MKMFVVWHYPFDGVSPSQMVYAMWPKAYSSMEQAIDEIYSYIKTTYTAEVAEDPAELAIRTLEFVNTGLSWYEAINDQPIRREDLPDYNHVYCLSPYTNTAIVVQGIDYTLNHDNITPLKIVHSRKEEEE